MLTWGKVTLTFCRNYRVPKSWNVDAVKTKGVKYFPRKKNFEETAITPTKLLMVQRVKPFKGNPYWEKDILNSLGIGEEEKKSKYAIVKNTPEQCAQLWKIKHLIKVSPVELPNMPIENITDRTWLQESGRLLEIPKIDPVRYEAGLKQQTNKTKLTHKIIEDKLRRIWLNGDVPS